jgi:outer membrane immunogenic protein
MSISRVSVAGLAATVLSLSVVPVLSADLYAPIQEVAPVSYAPHFDWAGPYLGLNAGWGWTDGSAEYADPTDCPDDTIFGTIGCAVSLDPDGAFVGGQIGWNFIFGNGFMLGIEGDYDFASLSDDGDSGSGFFATHVDLDVDQLASVRARLGVAMGRWLPFATVGWGWAHAERSVFNAFLPGSGGSDSNWHNGWTAGAGLEYAINEHWSLKGEYRYMDLSTENYSVPTIGGGGTDVDLNIQTVQFGINRHW